MRHLPALAVAGAIVAAALLTDMAAKDAGAEQTEQTNHVACVKLYEAAPKPWCQPLPQNFYAPKP